MKYTLQNVLSTALLFLLPGLAFGQAPNLGTAANFVLFTGVGAVTNSGIPHLTHLTGNVGTNSGSSTGFGNVDGVMHDGDLVSGQCAADLLIAYNQLNTTIPTAFPGSLLGNGVTLAPGVYRIPSAATLNLNLILDAQGNPNAVFIFQIQGAFAVNSLAKVKLINGGLACNVFWKVEGMVSIASGVVMKGTIIANNAAIDMNVNDTLEGRALSTNGSITTNADLAYTPVGCGSVLLTGPAAPTFVGTAPFGIMSGVGPVTNTGITYVGGDVGTNSGLTTAFNPLFVTGMIHPSPDAATAAAAGDLTTVYSYLLGLGADIELLYPAQFGNDLVLTPHTYHMGAAATFTGNVYLNAQGNPNAVFVIQIAGALSTSTFSRVILVNGAQAQNVYWKVDGAVFIDGNSVFNGHIIGAGAITTNIGDSVIGKVFTTNGAVNINGSVINPAVSTCTAPAITGANNLCPGSTVMLSNTATGGMWSSNNNIVATVGSSSGMVTGGITGSAVITYTSPAACVRTFTMTVNASPSPITGASSVCIGGSTPLSNAVFGGTWSSSNVSLANVGAGTGIATGVATGTPTISYTISNGCRATRPLIVGANAGLITGLANVCAGSSIMLTDSTAGGAWSSSNTRATVSGGMVVGVAPGSVNIIYTLTNACGTTTATKAITVDTAPGAGSISGPSVVCPGMSITLTNPIPGGVWTRSNAAATVVNGLVTGVSPGVDIISYTVSNGCGSAVATKTVTVNALPDEGSIAGPSSVCMGSSIALTDGIAGGIWTSSYISRATVSGGIVTGVSAGSVNISYTVTNGCSSATAIKTLTIITAPAAITGSPLTICMGSTTTLYSATGGGVWSSSSMPVATIGATTGIVTPVSNGMSVISYAIGGGCARTTTVTVNASAPVTGPASICVGQPAAFSNSINGGVWSSSNSGLATVTSTGIVTGIIAGASTLSIRYTLGSGCVSSVMVMVKPLIASTGVGDVCQGQTVTLVNGTPSGGTWSSSNTLVATVAPVSSSACVVSGVSAGVVNMTFTTVAGCVATKTVVVNVLAPITGIAVVCPGQTTLLSNSIVSGIWSSSNTGMATVTAGGMVTGIHTGSTVVIRYTLPTGCVSTIPLAITVCRLGAMDTTTGITTTMKAMDISMFPNPNKGEFTIQGSLGTTDDKEVSFTITNMLGQTIYRNTVLVQNGSINEQLVLNSSVANGMYLLNVHSGTENKAFHFVIGK